MRLRLGVLDTFAGVSPFERASVAARFAGSALSRGYGAYAITGGLALCGIAACVLLRVPGSALQRFVQNIAIAGASQLSRMLIDRQGTASVWMFTAIASGEVAGGNHRNSGRRWKQPQSAALP